MNIAYVFYIFLALLAGAVVLLYRKLETMKKKLNEAEEKASLYWKRYKRKQESYDMLKKDYNKLSVESRLLDTKMAMMAYNNLKVRVSHLRTLLALKLEQSFPNDHFEKNKVAQTLLTQKLQNYPCMIDTALNTIYGDKTYVNILLMDCESKIIAPILKEVDQMSLSNKTAPKLDSPPKWNFEV